MRETFMTHILAADRKFYEGPLENGEVLILVDSCERPEEIDVNRAKKAEAKAKEELLQKKSIQEYQSAKLHLARAINRLKVKKRS